MNDLISRSKLLADMDRVSASGSLYVADDLFDAVKAAPAEDAEFVRHGRWKTVRVATLAGDKEVWRNRNICTGCGRWNAVRELFCPKCGAKMGKEEPHENQ